MLVLPTYLVASSVRCTLAWSEPSMSAPILLRRRDSNTYNQSIMSRLCICIKSINISKYKLNT